MRREQLGVSYSSEALESECVRRHLGHYRLSSAEISLIKTGRYIYLKSMQSRYASFVCESSGQDSNQALLTAIAPWILHTALMILCIDVRPLTLTSG
jgi:hypothetical protein